MFPDFLVIGTQKAGTTWLHRNLQSHPRIWMPKEKELHYFDEKMKAPSSLWRRFRGNRPADVRWRRQVRRQFKAHRKKFSYQDLRWDLKYFLGRYNDNWYASLFEQGKGYFTGETTPSYGIIDRERVARVREIMPEAKIVFMMRSPIERDWSAVEMGLRFKGRSPDQASTAELQAEFDRPKLRLFSDYMRTLENWSSFYPPEQIFVGFLEDISFFPNELLRDLYGFLGVDASAKYRVITRKIHSGTGSTMSARFASRLAGSYHEALEQLAADFGGYTSFWLYCAQRLIDEPPEEETIAYPLYESYLWDEWLKGSEGARPDSLQSGPLSSIQAVT
jgi:hypothetical protein